MKVQQSEPSPMPWIRARRLRSMGLFVGALLVVACTGDVEDRPGEPGTEDVQGPGDVADTGVDAVDTDRQDARPDEPGEWTWSTPLNDWPAAFLSVHGSSAEDVWIVGAEHEGRATVLRWHDQRWQRMEAPAPHTLWWVHAVSEDTVWFGGEHGQVLRWQRGAFERLQTPSLARQTVFGVWAPSEDEVYAVGGVGSRSGFVWHYREGRWTSLQLPADMPRLHHGEPPALFKVWGDGETLWIVGGESVVLQRVGDGPLTLVSSEPGSTLFTVAGSEAGEVWAVGGGVSAQMQQLAPERRVEAAEEIPLLQGVAMAPSGEPWASGAFGTVWTRDSGGWGAVDPGIEVVAESLHAIWLDPSGGVWSVGGSVISAALDEGVLLHGRPPGGPVAPGMLPPPVEEPPPAECPDPEPDLGSWSPARVWNEMTLGAIRRAFPEPTVHARNLYHVSLALHDAWAFFEQDVPPLVFEGEWPVLSLEDRREVMSHAAYRLLEHRYAAGEGGTVSLACFQRALALQGFAPEDALVDDHSPAGVGRRIGQAIVDAFAHDGALEREGYVDPTYRDVNPPLLVDDPGIVVDAIDDWQPLDIAVAVTQNGIPEDAGPQRYIGPHWGTVVPFALRRSAPGVPYVDVGERPSIEDPEIIDWVEEVLRLTAWLDIDDGVRKDISPGAMGNTQGFLGLGPGHPENPVTGEPYAPQEVLRGDFGRVLAEYWADGPNSETPPGHWNVFAHRAFDAPGFAFRWRGEGEPLDRLTWDVRLFLVLNGALHDAAIVAWELKRNSMGARPVSLVRYMAQLGQSSEPDANDYHPRGLRLVPGLVERITETSSRPGERHAHLAAHVGELALWSWPGDPGDPETQRSPMQWIRAVSWMPYQPRTFVTPAFPGFVSGHSTFSRTAADVLSGLTGSPFVPGGLGEFVARRNAYLEFELGPSEEVRLQWGTWRDAADMAGESRIWGGIHVRPDDTSGRMAGAEVAQWALEWAYARFSSEGERPGVPRGTPEDVPLQPPPDPGDTFPAEEGASPDGASDFVVGTGRQRFEALLHGDALRWEAGVQGGHHVWVTAALDETVLASLSDEERRELTTRIRLFRRDGSSLGELSRRGGYRLFDHRWELTGNFLILVPGLRPGRLDDEPLRLEAEVELPGGSVRESRVWVRSACCD